MARTRLIATIIGVLVAALTLTSNMTFASPSASPDDTARFLAGLPPSAGSPIAAYTNDAFWKQHARSFDESWNGLEKRQLIKIRSFVSKNLTNPQPVLFYFFSGPDFLYADAFFPSADTYIMAGLEPPGPVPDLSKFSRGELPGALRELRASLNSVLSYSFFQTKFMRIDFSHGRMTGTLPVLMTFLARSGKTIYDVSLFDLQSDGTIHPAEEKIPNATAKGAKIVFSDNVGKKRTLYYFSTDLSDGGIKTSGFMQFCDTFGHGDSFIKSASYLMHADKFSTVRDYLLKRSDSILEDDSGIPIRYFAQGWRLYPYGRYVGPIALFAGQRQSQLSEVFGKGRATPIDFGIGYRWRPMESNLLLAVKDSTVTAMEIPPAKLAAEASERKVRADTKGDIREAKADPPPRRRVRTYQRHREQTSVYNPYKLFGYTPY
jgi:hypothetical protein